MKYAIYLHITYFFYEKVAKKLQKSCKKLQKNIMKKMLLYNNIKNSIVKYL